MLLLPDNVRIRRFNMSSEEYSDYVENAEHIKALDYMWDPEGESLSKNTVAAKKVVIHGYKESCKFDFSVVPGVVYWTVLGRGSQFGSIKRAYMTTFNDHGNNPVREMDLNLRYISNPDGIAVDWVGG